MEQKLLVTFGREAGAPPRAGALALFLVAGIAWGVFAQATAEVPILLNLTTYMGTWVCLVVTTGRALVTPRRAAVGGAAVLLVCVLAFYTTRALMQWLLANPGLTLFWCALGAVAGTILGWLGATTRSPGPRGAVAVLAISALLAGEAIYVLTRRDDPTRLGLVAFDLVASVAISVRWVQQSSTRLVVLAALPVVAVICSFGYLALPLLLRVLHV
jgi:hypothetical protein